MSTRGSARACPPREGRATKNRSDVKIVKITALVILTLILIFVSLGAVMPSQDYSTTVLVNATREKCWQVFHDTTKIALWTEGLTSIKQIQGDSLAPGAVYELVIVQGEEMILKETVTEIVKPSHVGYVVNNEVLESKFIFDFVDQSGQTQITAQYHVTGNNFIWKSVFVFFGGYFKSESQKQLDALKKVIESN